MSFFRKFISTFTIAVSNCSLYPADNELIDDLAKKVHSIIDEFITNKIELMVIDDDIIINKSPVKDAGLHGINLVKRLKKKGISSFEFLKGLTLLEVKEFIMDLAKLDKGIKSYLHIKTGIANIKTIDLITNFGVDIDNLNTNVGVDIDSSSDFNQVQIDKLKEVYYKLSPFKKLNMAGLEEIVAGFVATFNDQTNVLNLLSPVKDFSNYTYVHSTNVAILTIFQAETLGIKDELLRDIGLAALLHDVGKLFISKEVLEKEGPLDEREFAEMMLHPAYGSNYLAKIDNISRIAPIVAFEHHRKYNGTGYPRLNIGGKAQHFCSQLVAISDFFDALRSWRPYRKSWEIKEVIELMKQEKGKDFNPSLVDNFLKFFLTALSKK